jgi:hypothetical protein
LAGVQSISQAIVLMLLLVVGVQSISYAIIPFSFLFGGLLAGLVRVLLCRGPVNLSAGSPINFSSSCHEYFLHLERHAAAQAPIRATGSRSVLAGVQQRSHPSVGQTRRSSKPCGPSYPSPTGGR